MKFFHLKSKARRRKNFIASLQDGNDIATDQARKVEVATAFFQRLVGTPQACCTTVDWDRLGLQ